MYKTHLDARRRVLHNLIALRMFHTRLVKRLLSRPSPKPGGRVDTAVPQPAATLPAFAALLASSCVVALSGALRAKRTPSPRGVELTALTPAVFSVDAEAEAVPASQLESIMGNAKALLPEHMRASEYPATVVVVDDELSHSYRH